MWLLLRWQELAHCRDSRSTISGGRGGGGGTFDYLGRPVLNNNSRRGRDRPLDRDEESRLRVESYVRNSNMSLVSVFLCMRMSEQVKTWFPEIVECISPSLIISAYLPDDDVFYEVRLLFVFPAGNSLPTPSHAINLPDDTVQGYSETAKRQRHYANRRRFTSRQRHQESPAPCSSELQLPTGNRRWGWSRWRLGGSCKSRASWWPRQRD